MYDITWSRRVVTDWLKFCTRVEELDSLYEEVCESMGKPYALPVTRTLFDDLAGLVAKCSGKPANQQLWLKLKREVKAWHALELKEVGKWAPCKPSSGLLLSLRALRVASIRDYRVWVQGFLDLDSAMTPPKDEG